MYICIMNDQLLNEVQYYTSRATGPGGQHVNKTESRVELHWMPEKSDVLSVRQKRILLERLSKRLTGEGILIMRCQATRSQIKNREILKKRFLDLISKSLQPRKKRVATHPPRASVEKRLREKKKKGEKKKLRGKGGIDQ
ncbi:MAG: aminoacyl-tRNA hydrolase [Bacteroidales bacterium]|nr:aminoacyl-tRNA hydrolase [Bacteroidales bacterium]